MENKDFNLDLDMDMNLEETAVDNEMFNAPSMAQNNQVANKVEFKFDFGKLNIPGVMVGDIGISISKFPVDKIKFTKAKRELISIVSPQVLAIKTHYIEGVGSILCNGKTCCKVDGSPRIRYLFPIVVYDVDSKGKPVSNKLNFKVLSVAEGVYQDIATLMEVQDLTTIDLLVTCKDEQYQDISLTPAGNCRWQSQPKLVEQVVEFWNEHMEDIVKPIAREVEEDILREQLGMGNDNINNSQDVDFSDFIG
jgi:hypothetical protein